MAEYGNALMYVSESFVLSDGEAESMLKLLNYDFERTARAAGFPEDAEFALMVQTPKKFFVPVKEDGTEYTEDEEIPEDAEKVWKGQWLHMRGWFYYKDET